MRDRTRALTLAALCSAVSTLLLLLSEVLPAQRLAMLCLSSLGVVACLCRNGSLWALGSYAVSAALSFLLLPEKSMALAYGLFCGYYPVLKLKLEGLPSRFLRYLCKLACFNLALCLFFLLAKQLPLLPLGIVALGCNGAFLLYDYALGKLILLYLRKIAGRIDHG